VNRKILMSAGLVLLGCLAVALVSAALFTATYNMSATTTLRNVGLYSDQACTVLITPLVGYVLTGTLQDGSVLTVYAKNIGTVSVAVSVVPETNVSCIVVYAPLTFTLAVGAVQPITLTFSNVIPGVTATWTFRLDAS